MATIDIDSLEPNSHKYNAEKAAKKDRKKIAPVVGRDQIVSTKKPLGRRLSETFLTEDTKDVKSWVLTEVIIPGVKDTILDILNIIFYGDVDSRSRRGGRPRRGKDDDRVNYSSYYRGNSYSGRSSRRKIGDRYDSDDKVDFRNIVLRERYDAEKIVDEMRRRIQDPDIGVVSIGDLLDMIDVAGRFTDFDYGWDDERDIGIRKVSSGFLIDVAEPKYIK